ncbi:MAG: FecR domain-containing protein [Polyangiaceae bacterium]
MTQPPFARWAGRLLGSQGDESRPVDEKERERAISAIERAIRERGRQRVRRTWILRFGAAAAAAAILVAGLTILPSRTAPPPATAALAPVTNPEALTIVGHVAGSGATIYSRPGSASTLEDGEPIAAGNRITARGGSRATLAFSTGTQLSVEDGGDLTVVEQGRSQIFALGTGEMRARVAKLAADERFIVRTPDAEIEVRGTAFSVALAPADPSCGAGTVTRVLVDEGVVVVRQGSTETRVAKGEEWPAGCDLSFEKTDPSSDPPATPFARRHHAAREEGASASSLAAQNNLFAEALSYKNGGQRVAAVAAFERFTAKYPSSNLAENAAVERMKLLLADDRPRGVDAATQYLRRYPDGFARAEAKAAIAGNP